MPTVCGMIWGMKTSIPLALDFKTKLEALGHADMQELSRLSTVPFTTLWKIRAGETLNPGIETVKLFAPHLSEIEKATS